MGTKLKKRALIFINGPNLNLLGDREKPVYGNKSLEDIELLVCEAGKKMGLLVDFKQSNYEGEIIDIIHSCKNSYDMIIINPAAYTHYSYAIADAIRAVAVPAIEIHISNIYKREEFRHKSVIAPVCLGQISGFGADSYKIALYAAHTWLSGQSENEEVNSRNEKSF